MFCLPQTLI